MKGVRGVCKQKAQPHEGTMAAIESQLKERAERDLHIEGCGNSCSHFFKLKVGHAATSAVSFEVNMDSH